MVMPDVLNSNCSSSSLTSNNQSSTMINHHHHHHPMSSLSTTDEYSSRYSSLQDSESLKSAILDSFRMHWIQAWSIMECKILNDITIDDLSSIVNHIEQMISLLMEENVNDVRTAASMSDIKTEHTSSSTTSENSSHHSCSHNANNSMIIESSNTSSLSPLMEFLSNESILEKIFQWSEMSGEWKNAMYLEQLKLYELLISQLCQTDIVLFKPSFFQPLIYLLESLSTFLMTNYTMMNNYVVEIEKRLVLLLNTLCVIISQNNRLLNVFIINQKYSAKINNPNTKLSSSNDIYDDMILNSNHHKTDNTPPPKQQSSLDSYNQSTTPYCDNEQTNKNEENDNQDDCENFSFPLFSLLIQFVHRDGPIGQQSRDAILLCLAMSRHDERLAYFVANKTDFCPILATGLSGHFSSLPRVLIAANNNDNNNNNQSFSINSKINTEQYQSYQFKHELLTNSKEIDHFLKCLDFCNAVVQMSHPIIQVQLLKYTFNGFLISVIGPALHQNTLDEIITTTAYLDLFIRTTSEPKLIRIFLEFLCFEVYDNNFIISTLINRITAKSKLSLVTLIFFKTLLDLNCEDLLYELIFKHLMRGRHLKEESHVENNMSSKHYAQSQSYLSYQKNWLAISAQKLLSTSISYYLNSLCPHQMNIEVESISSIESNSSKNCKCHSDYFLHYIDYLNDARQNLEQCHLATKTWRNSYNEPCHLLNEVHDENIIFCTIDRSNLNGNNNNNVNDDNNDLNHDDCDHKQQHQSIMTAMMGDDIIDINDIITQNTLLAKFSPGFKMKNCYYDFKLKKINYKVETNKPSFFGMMNILSNNNNGTNNDWSEPSPIGSFLTVLFMKFEKFFENEVITNLHLTGLLTRLCHFHHKLLLSLLFDETLSRTKNVPCFIHLVQKLSIEAQNYCDEIPDFETVFQAAKSNLQSMPLGEVDCSLLVGNNSGGSTNLRSSSNASSSNETNNTGSQHKAFGLLKNLFFRSTNSSSSTSTTLNRRPSNASIVSSTGQMLEVVPGGIRFINQTLLQQQREIREQRDQAQNVNRFNQLVYNLIVFDEFLMELSAILIEHSLRYIEN